MAEVDPCSFCGIGVPAGKQCNCPGARNARQNQGCPEGDAPVTTITSPDDVIDLDDEYDD